MATRFGVVGHQQVSSTRRRWPASATNSGVSRMARSRSARQGRPARSRAPGPGWPPAAAPLAEKGRLVDRVGDEQDRRAGLLPDLQQLLVQPVARDLVERAERLVHQQQPRPPRPARGRSPRAGACRRTARADRPSPSRQARPAPAIRAARGAPRQSLPPPTSSGSVDVLQRVRHGSRAASWNTKPISRFCRAVLRRHRPAPRSARWSERSGRPPRAARSTCRSPTARAGSGSCRAGSTRSMFSSAVTVPRSVVKRNGDVRADDGVGAGSQCADRSARGRDGHRTGLSRPWRARSWWSSEDLEWS